MKKFSFLMALIMILAVCTSALGASALDSSTVAVIGEAEYASLSDAYTAAKAGDTITIVKDINVTSSITLDGTEYVGTGSFFKGAVKIDGNGKTYTVQFPKNKGTPITVKNADITIENLTIASNGGGIEAFENATLILNNCNVYTGNTPTDGTIPNVGSLAEGCKAVSIPASGDRSYVEINGGKYCGGGKITVDAEGKVTYSDAGALLENRGGTFVINDGEFMTWGALSIMQTVGFAVFDDHKETTCITYINGGHYSIDNINLTDIDTRTILACKGGIIVVNDGTFVNRAGAGKATIEARQGSVIGSHGSLGYHYILGGSFYNLNTCAGSVLLQSAHAGWYADNYVLGGTFYSEVMDGRVEVEAENTIDSKFMKAGALSTMEKSNDIVEYKSTPYSVTKYVYSYDKTVAAADAVAEITNADGSVWYAKTLWDALNIYAKDGSTVKLLADVTLDKELYVSQRYADITIDGNGKTVTAGTGVKSIANLVSGGLEIKNATLVNSNEGGVAFNLGEVLPVDALAPLLPAYVAELVLDNVTVTVTGDVYARNVLYSGTVEYKNATVNGTAKTEVVELEVEAPAADEGNTDGGDSGNTDSGNTDSGNTDSGNTDSGNTDTGNTNNNNTNNDTNTGDNNTNNSGKTEEKKGCGSIIGVGAIAVLAVAGAACGFAAKKRED